MTRFSIRNLLRCQPKSVKRGRKADSLLTEIKTRPPSFPKRLSNLIVIECICIVEGLFHGPEHVCRTEERRVYRDHALEKLISRLMESYCQSC